MGQGKETAEEQLLRMIEGGSGPQPPRRSGRAMVAGWRQAALSVFDQVRRFAMPGQPVRAHSDVLLIRLHLAERIVWVLLIGLGIYLFMDLTMMRRRLPALSLPPQESLIGQQPNAGVGALRPLNDYRDPIVSRNPFHQRVTKAVVEAVTRTKLDEMTAGLVVVGINRGRIPEALIEDTAAKRTHFVRVGDQLNGMTIKSIDAQSVVVTYQDEEATLQ